MFALVIGVVLVGVVGFATAVHVEAIVLLGVHSTGLNGGLYNWKGSYPFGGKGERERMGGIMVDMGGMVLIDLIHIGWIIIVGNYFPQSSLGTWWRCVMVIVYPNCYLCLIIAISALTSSATRGVCPPRCGRAAYPPRGWPWSSIFSGVPLLSRGGHSP